jgi:hypothetical protein
MFPYDYSTAQEKAEATHLRFDRLETQCYCAKAASAFLAARALPNERSSRLVWNSKLCQTCTLELICLPKRLMYGCAEDHYAVGLLTDYRTCNFLHMVCKGGPIRSLSQFPSSLSFSSG